ncbi:MAG: YtxH domain-containing protein [Terriglobales bacterium]
MTFGKRNTAKQWARFAMKFGLVLSDPKLWSTLNDQLKDRAGDVSDAVGDKYDVVREKYEDATDRFSNAGSALRGESQWVAPTLCFLGGIGVGVGLGILFAPLSGEEVRGAIRDKAADVRNDVKNKVSKMKNRYRTSDAPFTGTDGD